MGFKDFVRKLSGDAAQRQAHSAIPRRPTRLDLGREDIEVSGESYRREAIANVFSSAARPLGGVIMRTALLVAEPANPYDRFAVAVYVDGQHVGYIPADQAPRVQAVVNAHASATGEHFVVPARLWACCENGQWSARVTLSLSGATEPEWSYVDVGAWPGDRSPDGSQRLTKTGTVRRVCDAEAAGLVRGRDFDSLRPDITAAKESGDVGRAMELLAECIDAAERRAKVLWMRPSVWPTEQAAVLLRKQKDYHGDIALLERFMAADPAREGTKRLRDRLTKARTLVGNTTPVPEPPPVADSRLSVSPLLELPPGTHLVAVRLPVAVEVSYERECRGAIAAVFADAGAAMGTALETEAVLREFQPSGKRYHLVAVYVDSRLIGCVNGIYLDQVREVLHAPALVNGAAVVRCRIYATDSPKWSARATLGPYESVVASLDDTQSAAEGRASQAMMAELRAERLAGGGPEALAQSRRLVRGRDFVEWVEPIKQLRRDGHEQAALELLMECISAAERDAAANGWGLPNWYTEQAAIILRKNGDHAGEIAVLERYLAACPGGTAQSEIAERLIKARAKASRVL